LAIKSHETILNIETGYLAQHHIAVCLSGDDCAERRGDIGWREPAGSDLIQQRLELVKIAPIDERDHDGRSPESFRRVQIAEAASDDDDAVGNLCGGWRDVGRHDLALKAGSKPAARARG